LGLRSAVERAREEGRVLGRAAAEKEFKNERERYQRLIADMEVAERLRVARDEGREEGRREVRWPSEGVRLSRLSQFC
jgi:hypothetical protein